MTTDTQARENPGIPETPLLKQFSTLTWPILLTQMAQIGMGLIDTAMSGHISVNDLAAVAFGSSFWSPVLLLVAGTMLAFTTMASKMAGAGKVDDIVKSLGSAVTCGVMLGIISGLILAFIAPLVSAHILKNNADSGPMMVTYLQAVAWGMPTAGGFMALRFHAEAVGHAFSVTRIMLAGLLLNIPANAMFVYGWFGIPAMGGPGCGWGTSLVFLFLFIAMAFDCYRKRIPENMLTREILLRVDPAVIKAILVTGIPIGLAIFFEVSFFSAISLFLAPLGNTVVSGHQIAFSISGFSFMIPLSVGMASTVIVSRQLGRGHPEAAREAAWLAMKINAVTAFLIGFAIVLFRPFLASLFTSDPEVISIAVSLLLLAAIYQFSDGIQIAAAGALRGYMDTRFVSVVALVAYWGCGVGLGFLFTYGEHFMLGEEGFWIGIVCGLTAAAIMLGYRLNRISKQHIPAE